MANLPYTLNNSATLLSTYNALINLDGLDIVDISINIDLDNNYSLVVESMDYIFIDNNDMEKCVEFDNLKEFGDFINNYQFYKEAWYV